MPKITSRPTGSHSIADLERAIQPTLNAIEWMTDIMYMPDNTHESVGSAYDMLEGLLDCMMLSNFIIMTSPGSPVNEVHFDVAAQPVAGGPHLAFRAAFRVQQ